MSTGVPVMPDEGCSPHALGAIREVVLTESPVSPVNPVPDYSDMV